MKTLIYRYNQFYLCDDVGNKKGKTYIISDYEPSPTNMPHTFFKANNYKYKHKDANRDDKGGDDADDGGDGGDGGDGDDNGNANNNDKTIFIYARPSCPHCIGFVKFLKKNNKQTQFYDNLIYVEVDSEGPKNMFSKKNILKNLNKEIGNHTTVPIVFYKGKFIGGADKSKEYFESI